MLVDDMADCAYGEQPFFSGTLPRSKATEVRVRVIFWRVLHQSSCAVQVMCCSGDMMLSCAGEWYGRPAEMKVVCTYDAEAPDGSATAEKEESSNTDHGPDVAPAQPEQPPGVAGGSRGGGGDADKAAAAADALLRGPLPARVRRFALLEFTFEAAAGS